MRTIDIARLERLARNRLPGYLDACRACAIEATATILTFDMESECWKDLAKYRPTASTPLTPKKPAKAVIPRSEPQTNGPGTLVKTILEKMGHEVRGTELICANGKSVKMCGCAAMQRQMDQWGWSGCLLRLPTLIHWFAKKAKTCDVEMDIATVREVISAAIRQSSSENDTNRPS